MTKFFSMRSRVVARSIPWRISLSLSDRSQLSLCPITSVLNINSSGSIRKRSSCLLFELLSFDPVGVETRPGVLKDFEASSDCLVCLPGVGVVELSGFTIVSLLTDS